MAVAGVPENISEGFDAYKESGRKAAVERWQKGGHWNEDLDPQKILSELEEFELRKDAYEYHEVFRVVPLSSRSAMYFFFAYYEKSILGLRP